MEEYLELYHGTLRENAVQIIKKQYFLVKEDFNNELFLGTGAYFYFDKINAIEWNSRNISKHNKTKLLPSFIELKNKYSIIKAICNVKAENILDLDNRDDILKYKLIVNKIKKYINIDLNCKNQLSIIINYLYKENLLNSIYIILKTFLFPINRRYGITLNKRMACVKNIDIIKKYEETEITLDEYNKLKILFE